MDGARRVVAVVLLAALPATSRADDAGSQPGFEAPFTLYVNDVAKGDVNVVLLDSDVLVVTADLEAAGLSVVGGQQVERDGKRMLSLRSVSPPLRYEIDEREVALRVFAPAHLLPLTVVDLRAAPRDIAYTTTTSAFLSYGTQLTDRGNLTFYEETGLSFDGKLFQSGATFSTDSDPVRGLTRLTIDNRPALTRCTFGDTFVNTGPLGAGALLGGASVSRTYELDPYALKTPGLGYSGSTLTPATLEVYVNGSRVRSEPIPPGTFDVKNVLPPGGPGTATYVIRDIFGNEQQFSQPFYASSSLLREGLHEYTYATGLVRRDPGTESWAYERPVALGTHRIGVDEDLTVGGRAEAQEGRASLGPTLTFVLPSGQLDIDAATSMDAAGQGFAAQVAFGHTRRGFSGAVYARSTSKLYSTVELEPEADRALLDVGLSFAIPIARVVSFGYRTSVASFRDRGLVAQMAGRIGTEILPGLGWSLQASHTASVDLGTLWTVSTTLSYGLGRGHRAGLSAETGSRGPSARVEVGKSVSQTEDYGYQVVAVADDPAAANGTAQYQWKAGRYTARYSVAPRRELQLSAAGGLVVIPGVGIMPTLPVQSSYGLIRLAGVGGVRGFGNGQDVGTTDRNGNLIVPNLLAYYGNRMSVDPESVPVDYELQASEMVLGPPPRGVAIADFTVTQPHYYRGTLRIELGGKRVVPKYGEVEVTDMDPTLVSPIGELGEFEVEGLTAGVHRFRIDYGGRSCEMEVDVQEGPGPVIELGEIVCAQAPSGVGAPQ